jgi:hypothetical protein
VGGSTTAGLEGYDAGAGLWWAAMYSFMAWCTWEALRTSMARDEGEKKKESQLPPRGRCGPRKGGGRAEEGLQQIREQREDAGLVRVGSYELGQAIPSLPEDVLVLLQYVLALPVRVLPSPPPKFSYFSQLISRFKIPPWWID